MIATYAAFTVHGVTETQLDAFLDQLSDIEDVCPELLDWSVGTDLGTGLVEIEMTIDSTDSHYGDMRSFELIEMAVSASGGAIAGGLGSAHKVRAELIDA